MTTIHLYVDGIRTSHDDRYTIDLSDKDDPVVAVWFPELPTAHGIIVDVFDDRGFLLMSLGRSQYRGVVRNDNQWRNDPRSWAGGGVIEVRR